MEEDWRDESQRLSSLFAKYHVMNEFDNTSDIKFKLPDGSTIKAHKLVLGVVSEVFHSMFYGPMADGSNEIEIVDINSDTFREMISSIYNSGAIKDLNIEQLLSLLFASHYYLLHGNIRWCQFKIMSYLGDITDVKELADWCYKMSQISIHECLFSYCRDLILSKLPIILKEDKWNIIEENVQDQLLGDLRCSINGFDWDLETDQDHYWRMIDFAKKFDLKSLEDHCLEQVNELLPRCFPLLLSYHINRAALTKGAEEIFMRGLTVFVESTTTFRWFIQLVNDDELDVLLAWKSLNQKAILGILEQIKDYGEDDKQLILNGVRVWTSNKGLSKAEEEELLKKASDSEDK